MRFKIFVINAIALVKAVYQQIKTMIVLAAIQMIMKISLMGKDFVNLVVNYQ